MSPQPEATTSAPTDTAASPVKTDTAGLLIVRAWVEEGSTEPLRAEVRSTIDVSAGIERSRTLARPEEVGATVRDWLAEVLGDRPSRG